MTPERWQQVKELFNSALEREQNQRSAFLAQACGDDEYLRSEVESLLSSMGEMAASWMPRLLNMLRTC